MRGPFVPGDDIRVYSGCRCWLEFDPVVSVWSVTHRCQFFSPHSRLKARPNALRQHTRSSSPSFCVRTRGKHTLYMHDDRKFRIRSIRFYREETADWCRVFEVDSITTIVHNLTSSIRETLGMCVCVYESCE